MRTLILTLIASLALLNAAQLGTLKKLEGKAKVEHARSLKKVPLKVGDAILAGDTVYTFTASKAVIEMADKSSIVLDAHAKLKMISENEYAQNGGKVFFKVTSRKGRQGLKVTTPFAIIGVKGTQFVISDENVSKSLSLNEGLVGVDSPDGSKYEKIDEDKLKAKLGTPQEVNAEFEAYKEELYREFAEFTSSFDLNPGKKLRFEGKRVFESAQDSGDSQMFKLYMSDAEFEAISKELEEDVTGTPQGADEAFEDNFFKDEL